VCRVVEIVQTNDIAPFDLIFSTVYARQFPLRQSVFGAKEPLDVVKNLIEIVVGELLD